MSDDLVAFWESELKKAEERLKETPARYKELSYMRDVVPYKIILRMVRNKADTPICWGAYDCLDVPLSQCEAGKHETCEKHRDSCFLCKGRKKGAK